MRANAGPMRRFLETFCAIQEVSDAKKERFRTTLDNIQHHIDSLGNTEYGIDRLQRDLFRGFALMLFAILA